MGDHEAKSDAGGRRRLDADRRRLNRLRWFGAMVGLAVLAAVLVLLALD